MTSPQASRRGAFVAPALLFVALLGGALFFGLLAISGRDQSGVVSDNAAVTDPSPSKAAPAARRIVTTRPSTTGTPPVSGHGSSSAGDRPKSAPASEEARAFASLSRKPAPGRTTAPIAGESCAPAGTKARGATGATLVCKPGEDGGRNHWDDENDN